MNQDRRRLASQPPSKSKRWTSSMKTALEEVNSLRSFDDREQMVKSLAERKLANTKTSISFGNEKTQYRTHAQDNQGECSLASTAESRAQAARTLRMKADLTTTNFRLGDERSVTEYESANKAAMTHIVMFPTDSRDRAEKAEINRTLKEAVKRSSLEFGNEPILYESVTATEMKRQNGQINNNDYNQRRQEISDMTASLRKHNFSLGDQAPGANKGMYETDYNRGFGSLPASAYAQRHVDREEIKRITDDSRHSHYSIGNDSHKVDYSSVASQSMQKVYSNDEGLNNFESRSEEMERARRMKISLLKTSIIIGDDKEYF